MEGSIRRVFQNEVSLFYYGRANKFFQSWPLRYHLPLRLNVAIQFSPPPRSIHFFFEYLSTVRVKSSRENLSLSLLLIRYIVTFVLVLQTENFYNRGAKKSDRKIRSQFEIFFPFR